MKIDVNKSRSLLSKDFLTKDILKLANHDIPSLYLSIEKLSSGSKIEIYITEYRIVLTTSYFYIYEFLKDSQTTPISDFRYSYTFCVNLSNHDVDDHELLLFYRQLINFKIEDDFIIELNKKLIDDI